MTQTVLVCGGRNFRDYATLKKTLRKLHETHGFARLIHGAARGADALADHWARATGIPVKVYPAQWERHGRSAGFRRNEEMLRRVKPDLVVAFPGGPGSRESG